MTSTATAVRYRAVHRGSLDTLAVGTLAELLEVVFSNGPL